MSNEIKENDWLAVNLANNQYTIDDFRNNGVNITNTSFGTKDVYEKNPQVQALPEFQTNGKFDKSKFETYYDSVAASYNNLADSKYHDDVMKYAMFHRDNIFVPINQTRQGYDTTIIKDKNPMGQVIGLYRPGEIEEPTQTAMERAESKAVFDPDTQTWHDAPEEAFWSSVANPMALAQWDTDGDSVDPFTGELEHHSKGELKTNDQGYYYFEYLNGRSPIGRQMLKDTDILTKEGSWWNHYDFMDADDKKKSTIGTIVKDALPIALFAIPYVNTVYIAGSLLKEAVGIGAAVGKCFAGSDNKLLNTMDAYAQSLGTSTSEYAQQHPWAIENILNMASDTYQMLYEQRYIFKVAPKLFGMKDLNGVIPTAEEIKNGATLSDEAIAQQEFLTQKSAQYEAEYIAKIDKAGSAAQKIKDLGLAKVAANSRAAADLREYIESYNNLGKQFSQAYMTLAPVAGVYNELKQEGATDPEASMMTLGVAAANGWLMSLPIGSWVLPELRMDKLHIKNIIKMFWNGAVKDGAEKDLIETAAKTATKEGGDIATKTAKNQYLSKLFDNGKKMGTWLGKIVKGEFSPEESATGLTMKAAVSNSVGMGLLGVGFDVLLDLSKSITNTVRWFNGDKKDDLPTFNNIMERYGKDMLGGFLGGGLMQFASDFRAAQALVGEKKTLTFDAARQEIVALIRNGQRELINKTLDSMPAGDMRLASKAGITQDGKLYFKEGNSSDNHDVIVKKIFKQQLDRIQDILELSGSNKTDSQILDIQTMKDLRFAKLQKSLVASAVIRDFNHNVSRLTVLKEQAEAIAHPTIEEKMAEGKTDASEKSELKNAPNVDEEKLKAINTLIKQYQDRIDAYNDGSNAKDFIAAATYELAQGSSERTSKNVPTFEAYVAMQEDRDITNVPENRLKFLKEEYEEYKYRAGVDRIITGAEGYKNLAKRTTPIINDFLEGFQQHQDLAETFMELDNDLAQGLHNLTEDVKESGTTKAIPEELQALLVSKLIQKVGSTILEGTSEDGTSITLADLFEKRSAEKSTYFGDLYTKFMEEALEGIIGKASKFGIDPLVKKRIVDFLFKLNMAANEGTEELTAINDKILELNNIKATPVTKMLDRIALSESNYGVRVSEVLSTLEDNYKKQSANTGTFNIDSKTKLEIANIKNLLEPIIGLIEGATVNDVDTFNLFELNKVLNEVYGGKSFAEVPKDVADAMLYEMQTIKTALAFYETLDAVNSGKKLNVSIKAGIQKNISLYDKYQKFIPFIPDTWKGKDKLQEVIDSAEKLKRGSDARKNNVVIDDLDRKQVCIEMIKINDAIYEFFKANEDKPLSEIINSKNFNFYEDSDQTITEKEAFIDDATFVYHLATCAIVPESEFKYKFKEIIRDNIAPIEIQEMEIRATYSFLVNRDKFSKFTKEIINSLKKDSDNYAAGKPSSDAPIPWSKVLDSAYAPIYENCLFIEGVAGCGKTNAALKMAVVMLQKYCPYIFKQVLLSSVNLTAIKDAVNITATTPTVLDRASLMTTICPEWKEELNHGMLQVDMKDLSEHEYGLVHSKWKIVDTATPYSLIIIDEISKYSQIDLDLINAYAKKYGTHVIVSGDLDQLRNLGSGKEGSGFKTKEGKVIPYYTQICRGNFPRVAKNGVSLRVNNSQKQSNAETLQVMLEAVNRVRSDGKRSHLLNSEINLKYYEDDKIIKGDKVFNAFTDINEDFFKSVQKLINNLKNEEVLGFIAQSETSKIYNQLKQQYGDKIKYYPYGSVLGSEADYYIIEGDSGYTSTDAEIGIIEQKLSELYTYTTRAREASLVILEDPNTDSIKESETRDIKMNEKDISDASSTTKELYTEVLKDYNPTDTKYVKPQIENTGTEVVVSEEAKETSNESVITVKEENPDRQSIDPTKSVTEPVEETKNINENASLIPSNKPINENLPGQKLADKDLDEEAPVHGTNIVNQEYHRGVINESNQSPEPDKPILPEKEPITEVEKKKVQDELTKALNAYTFSTFESGWIRQEDGSLVPSKYYNARIDSFNGIQKLNPNLSELEKYQLLGELQNTIIYEADLNTMLSKIKKILNKYDINLGEKKANGSDNDLFGTFAFKTYIYDTNGENSERFGRFVKEGGERLDYVHVIPDSEDSIRENEPRRKGLVFIIGEGNENKLEIPILTLPNADSVMLAFKGTEIYHDWEAKGKPKISEEKNKVGRKWLEDYLAKFPDSPEGKILKKLDDVYTIQLSHIYYLRDFSIAKDLIVNGIFINNKVKGASSEYNKGFKYNGQWITLEEAYKDPRFVMSDILMSASGKYQDLDVAKKGDPFVLIAPMGTVKQSDLQKEYLAQLQDPNRPKKVILYYVEAPSGTIKDYMNNLISIIKGNKNEIKNIGTPLTALKISKILFGLDNSFIDSKPGPEDLAIQLQAKRDYFIKNIDDTEKTVELYDTLEPIVREILTKCRIDGGYNLEAEKAELSKMITIGTQKESVKFFLQKFLMQTAFEEVIDTNSPSDYAYSYNEHKFTKFENALTKVNFNRVYFSVNYATNERGETFALAKTDTNNKFSLEGQPFMLNGKIEGTRISGNLEPILDRILDRYYKGRDDNASYIANHSNLNHTSAPVKKVEVAPKATILEQYLDKENKNIVMDDSVRNSLSEYFKGIDKLTVTEDQIKSKLLSEGHFVIQTKTRTFVSRKISENKSGIEIVRVEQESERSSKYNVEATINGETYIGRFDARNPSKIELTRENTPNEPSSESPEAITPEFSMVHVDNYASTLDKGNSTYGCLISGTPEEIFMTLTDPDVKAEISNVVEDMFKNPDKYQLSETEKASLQEIYNIMFEIKEKPTSDECVTITINF